MKTERERLQVGPAAEFRVIDHMENQLLTANREVLGRVPRGGVGTVDPRQDQVRVRQPELAG